MKNFIKWVLIVFVSFLILSGIISTCQDENPTPKTEVQIEQDREISAYTVSKDFIKKTLKAPSTAKFAHTYGEDPATVKKLENGNYRVVMWVDAQNAFGVMLRNRFVIEVKPQENDMWKLISINQLD